MQPAACPPTVRATVQKEVNGKEKELMDARLKADLVSNVAHIESITLGSHTRV